jgi:hypothetical protein
MKSVRKIEIHREFLTKPVERDILCYKFTQYSKPEFPGLKREKQGFILEKNLLKSPSIPIVNRDDCTIKDLDGLPYPVARQYVRYYPSGSNSCSDLYRTL